MPGTETPIAPAPTPAPVDAAPVVTPPAATPLVASEQQKAEGSVDQTLLGAAKAPEIKPGDKPAAVQLQ